MRLSQWVIRQDLCRRCGRCVACCPKGAIEEHGDKSVAIDEKLCDRCGTCHDVCKLRAIVKRHGLFS